MQQSGTQWLGKEPFGRVLSPHLSPAMATIKNAIDEIIEYIDDTKVAVHSHH